MGAKPFSRVLFGMLVASPIFAACSGTNDQAAGGIPETSLDIAVLTPEGDMSGQVMKRWGDRVTELTDGAITVKFFWSGSLVPPQESVRAVRDGIADGALQATSYASGDIVDLSILEVPFAYPVDSESLRKFHVDANPILSDIYAEHNQQLVFSNPAMLPTAIACRDKFLGDEAAWNGTLLRTAGSWQAMTAKAWNAGSVVVPTGELYTALQTGTADCAMLIYNLLDALSIPEVAPYMTRLDFSSNYMTVNINKNTWDSLGKAGQDALLQAGEEAHEYGLDLVDEMGDKVIGNLADGGAEFCAPSQAELERVVTATDRVSKAIESKVSENGRRLIEAARSYRDDVTSGPQFGPTTPC